MPNMAQAQRKDFKIVRLRVAGDASKLVITAPKLFDELDLLVQVSA